MKLVALSIYDVKAEYYFPPFFARTVGEGLRTFGHILSDPQNVMSKTPGDFRLYRCGEFDQELGLLVGAKEGLVLVEEGLQLIKEA